MAVLTFWPATAALAATWCDDYVEAWHYDANWNMIGYTFMVNHVVEWKWGSSNGYYNRIESWTICYSGGGRRTAPGGNPVVTVDSPIEGVYYADEDLLIDATATDPQYQIKRFDVRIDGVSVTPGESVSLSQFGVGVHVLAAAAFNSAGLYTLVVVPFTVEPSPLDTDTTPPTMACIASPSVLWPPNGKLVPIHLGVAIADDADPAPDWRIIGVTASDLGASLSDGELLAEVVEIAADGKALWLRARKSSLHDERVYSITLQGTDGNGNAAACTATVTVPHSCPQP
jgi:hypothetical protein